MKTLTLLGHMGFHGGGFGGGGGAVFLLAMVAVVIVCLALCRTYRHESK